MQYGICLCRTDVDPRTCMIPVTSLCCCTIPLPLNCSATTLISYIVPHPPGQEGCSQINPMPCEFHCLLCMWGGQGGGLANIEAHVHFKHSGPRVKEHVVERDRSWASHRPTNLMYLGHGPPQHPEPPLACSVSAPQQPSADLHWTPASSRHPSETSGERRAVLIDAT